MYIFACRSIYFSFFLSIYLSNYLSIYLCIYLSKPPLSWANVREIFFSIQSVVHPVLAVQDKHAVANDVAPQAGCSSNMFQL